MMIPNTITSIESGSDLLLINVFILSCIPQYLFPTLKLLQLDPLYIIVAIKY
jgi:hypothetical protein